MSILTCTNLAIAFGDARVLDDVELSVERGERLCISGRNGTGKSTLLRILADQLAPDEGSIWRAPGLKVSVLDQSLPEGNDLTVYDAIALAFEKTGKLLARYQHLLAEIEAGNFGAREQDELSQLQEKIEHADGWSFDHKIQSVLNRFMLSGSRPLKELSGGWRRRVAIARSLVVEPDLWLLDEPTNHLDIPTIAWLEQEMLDFPGTIIFVTHDRQLMQSVATSIVDIDRGLLTRWDCDYQTFLDRRQHQLEVEAVHNKEFDRKLKNEEVWIRKGIQARRTRNEGRVRALESMRKERKTRRVTSTLKLEADAGSRSGNMVMELSGVTRRYGEQVVVKDLDLIVQRGDRIGLLGPNGAGKSTLLKLLLEKIEPDAGSVKVGTRLSIAYFDQVRAQIDPDQTVVEAISDGRDYISINGKDTHVMSWLGNFLFSPERARSPVRVLSGGEQNRLLLAKLFSIPANLLVMDEPTNDLDVESLELLEELLLEYKGTVLLVTHDRTFLDNVVSSLLVFEGAGKITEFVGGYSDWRASGGDLARWHQDLETTGPTSEGQAAPSGSARENKKQQKRQQQKLEREYVALPDKIEAVENRIESLHDAMAAPGFFEQDPGKKKQVQQELTSAIEERDALYARWEELEQAQ